MKRSEMLKLMAKTIEEKSLLFCFDLKKDCEVLLDLIEREGMLPPTSTIVMIKDTVRGGLKHSETKREWDSEGENA